MKHLIMGTVMAGLAFVAGCGNEVEQEFTGSGTVEATEITVSAETAGRLNLVRFEEGDSFAAGDTLADIDVEALRLERAATAAELSQIEWNGRVLVSESESAQEAIHQAEIVLENARRSSHRIENLYNDNAATRDQFDRTHTEYELAQSRIAAARNKLDTIHIRERSLAANREKVSAAISLLNYRITKGHVLSPVDGTILVKYSDTGEFTSPGKPLGTLADLSTVWLTIYVGEAMLGNIALGDPVRISVDSHPDTTFAGTVTRIAQEAEFTPKNVQTRDSRIDLVYAVKITINNSGGIFKIGMPADAYIEGL